MDRDMIIEIFGYIGSILVVVSMLMSSIVKLRVINTVGSIISGIYAVIVGAIPLALMNTALIIINIINLVKLMKPSQAYELVETTADNSLAEYFLSRYDDDIKACFPDYSKEAAAGRKAYVVCCDGNMAGILIGEENDGVFDAFIDYSSPIYRDCSVGTYLYSRLGKEKLTVLKFSGKLSKIHESYLDKMGFVKENDSYLKKLV